MMLTQRQIDDILNASREADEGPTQLARRIEAAVQAAERERCVPQVDELAQHIRWLNGSHKTGAGTLAEKLVDWLRSRA